MPNPAVEKLLLDLEAPPRDAARRLVVAMGGKQRGAVVEALSTDSRFAPLLQRLCQDPDALDETPAPVQFLGRQRYEGAVAVLLRLWRKRQPSLSDQAGWALVQIGQLESLESMAKDLPELQFGGLALVSLAAADAAGQLYERAVGASADDVGARNVLYYLKLNIETLRADPRWIALVSELATDRSVPVARSAKELLTRALPPTELAAVLGSRGGELGFRFGPRPDAAALGRAKKSMHAVRLALPTSGFRVPPSDQVARLAEIEAVVGPLPAMVRALYETMDGLDVRGTRPGDRVLVFGLDTAQSVLDRFVRKHPPATTPRDLLPNFEFPIAPDGYERRGLSGGPDVAVQMPTDDDDPPLLNMRRRPKLSTYVKRARRYAKAAQR